MAKGVSQRQFNQLLEPGIGKKSCQARWRRWLVLSAGVSVLNH